MFDDALVLGDERPFRRQNAGEDAADDLDGLAELFQFKIHA